MRVFRESFFAKVVIFYVARVKKIWFFWALFYLAVFLPGFILPYVIKLFGTASNHFPFILNFVFTLIFAILVVVKRNSFTFRMSDQYV